MKKYKVVYQGKEIEIERLPNGKFKIPSLGQFTKQGLGSVWLDEGRIPYESDKDKKIAIDNAEGGYKRQKNWKLNDKAQPVHGGWKKLKEENFVVPRGRFPANLIVSNDALNDGKNDKGTKPHKVYSQIDKYQGWGSITKKQGEIVNYGDSGSFSRYFSLESWWEKRFKQLPASVQKTFPYLIVPKASKLEKNSGCEELYWEKDSSSFGYHQIDRARWRQLEKEEERIFKETAEKVSLQVKGNIHATVKPLKLMSYLVTLGSRPGDIVLDPFLGSGSTAIAAKMLRRHYIGYEIDPEYCRIAEARLSVVQKELF